MEQSDLEPTRKPDVHQVTEQAFKRRLLAMGLLTEIKSTPWVEDNLAPARMAGKPLSEIIIEDRR